MPTTPALTLIEWESIPGTPDDLGNSAALPELYFLHNRFDDEYRCVARSLDRPLFKKEYVSDEQIIRDVREWSDDFFQLQFAIKEVRSDLKDLEEHLKVSKISDSEVHAAYLEGDTYGLVTERLEKIRASEPLPSPEDVAEEVLYGWRIPAAGEFGDEGVLMSGLVREALWQFVAAALAISLPLPGQPSVYLLHDHAVVEYGGKALRFYVPKFPRARVKDVRITFGSKTFSKQTNNAYHAAEWIKREFYTVEETDEEKSE